VYIGRRRELEQVFDGIGKSRSLRNAPRLFRITAEDGMGKTGFVKRIARNPDIPGLPVLFIHSPDFERSKDPECWLDLLKRSARTSNNALGTVIAELRRSKPGVTKQEEQPEEEPEAPTEDNPEPEDTAQEEDAGEQSADDADKPISAGAMQDKSAKAAAWLKQLLKAIQENAGFEKARIVFLFDNWNKLDGDKKSFISTAFWQPSLEDTGETEIRFVLTATRYPSKEIFQTYWPQLEDAVLDLELKAFSEEETREFLSIHKVPAEEARKIADKAKGSPEKLAEALRGIAAENKENDDQSFALSLLNGKERVQRSWMLRAAHLQLFDTEGLALFGGLDKPDTVFNWLKGRVELKIRPQGNSYRVADEISAALRNWHEQENPDEFHKMQDLVHAFWGVCELVSEPRDRQILRLLSSFNYFNDPVLEEVLPADADTLHHFVDSRPAYFTRTEDNIRVAENYREAFVHLGKVSPLSNADELKRKINAAWQRRRDGLVEKASKSEDALKKLDKELEVVSANLTKLRQEDRRLQKGVMLASLPATSGSGGGGTTKQRSSVPRGRGTILAGVAVEVIGIFLLYMGILFADQLSVVYCSMGFLLVLGGLFWPYKKTVTQTVPGGVAYAAAPPPPQPARRPASDQNSRLLAMKLETLENKRKALMERIARTKRELSRLDTLLHESYC